MNEWRQGNTFGNSFFYLQSWRWQAPRSLSPSKFVSRTSGLYARAIVWFGTGVFFFLFQAVDVLPASLFIFLCFCAAVWFGTGVFFFPVSGCRRVPSFFSLYPSSSVSGPSTDSSHLWRTAMSPLFTICHSVVWCGACFFLFQACRCVPSFFSLYLSFCVSGPSTGPSHLVSVYESRWINVKFSLVEWTIYWYSYMIESVHLVFVFS